MEYEHDETAFLEEDVFFRFYGYPLFWLVVSLIGQLKVKNNSLSNN